mgnify:CR=1 FL=1
MCAIHFLISETAHTLQTLPDRMFVFEIRMPEMPIILKINVFEQKAVVFWP